MDRRQSKRLQQQREAMAGGVTPDGKRRDSVGAIIGVTPRKGAYGNAANKSAFRPFKPMVGWQGPYQITRSINGSPEEFMVRLLGETKEHPVH